MRSSAKDVFWILAAVTELSMPAIRILLIDQDAMFVDSTVDLLQPHVDLKVVAVAITDELSMLWARGLDPDVVLADLDFNGYVELKIVRDLRALLPGVGIVAVSKHDESPYQQAALSAGADSFVSKAHVTDHLVLTIQRVVQMRALP